MDFLADNYIWIIGAVVIILMTIIGYIAEKTDFGKKAFDKRATLSKNKKNSKKEQKEEPKTQDVISVASEQPAVNSIVEQEAPRKEVPVEDTKIEQTSPISESSTDDAPSSNLEPWDNMYDTSSSTSEDLNAPFGDSYSSQGVQREEDLNVPFGDLEVPKKSYDDYSETNYSSMNDSSTTMEDLNVPFGDYQPQKADSHFDMELPDIDSIKEDVSKNSSEVEEDDIWKF